MSVKIDKLENNKALLTIEVPVEDFERAVNQVYLKNKNTFNIPGFRKGKVPRKMIEKMYGEGVFYEDAANICVPEAYDKVFDEVAKEITIMSQPKISVTEMETGKPLVFTAEVCLRPEVKLGQYMGLEVEKNIFDVTDEDVEKEMQVERNKNARSVEVTNRPVKDGDMIRLDFDGYVDGEQFQGGKADNYMLGIGSGSFIPGFEEQLIGAEIGQPVDVNVTFPENYHSKELAGKPALFKCVVKMISAKELPELTDEFASEVSNFDTIDEWKKALKFQMMARQEQEANDMKKDAVIKKAVANAEVEIAEEIIDNELNHELTRFSQQLAQSGITMEQYMQVTNNTPEKVLEQFRPDSEERVRISIVLDAIARAEGIEIPDEEFEEEMAEMAKTYQMEVDEIKERLTELDMKHIREDLAVQKAVKMMVESAVEVEPAKDAE